MLGRGRRLGCGHKSRSDPDSLGSPHERRSQASPVGDTSGSNDVDGLSGEGRLLSLDGVDAGGDEDRGRDAAGVASTLATLRERIEKRKRSRRLEKEKYAGDIWGYIPGSR